MKIQTGDIEEAAICYLRRRARKDNPCGEFKKGRWLPSAEERCDCCFRVNTPSCRWPYTLMAHCRTLKHVAVLFQVDYPTLKRAVKEIEANPRFSARLSENIVVPNLALFP